MPKILVAVDASEQAQKAFDFYLENFYQGEHSVVVLHIQDPPKLPTLSFTEGGSFPADEISKIMTESNKKAAEVENRYTLACNQKKIKSKVVMRSGKPGEEIVKLATEEGVTAIVMGSRGLGTIRRTVLGSVSDYVLHHTKIPVIIIPKQ